MRRDCDSLHQEKSVQHSACSLWKERGLRKRGGKPIALKKAERERRNAEVRWIRKEAYRLYTRPEKRGGGGSEEEGRIPAPCEKRKAWATGGEDFKKRVVRVLRRRKRPTVPFVCQGEGGERSWPITGRGGKERRASSTRTVRRKGGDAARQIETRREKIAKKEEASETVREEGRRGGMEGRGRQSRRRQSERPNEEGEGRYLERKDERGIKCLLPRGGKTSLISSEGGSGPSRRVAEKRTGIRRKLHINHTADALGEKGASLQLKGEKAHQAKREKEDELSPRLQKEGGKDQEEIRQKHRLHQKGQSPPSPSLGKKRRGTQLKRERRADPPGREEGQTA